MTPSLMTDQQPQQSEDAARDAVAARIRAHRERRAQQYGRDRNDAELGTEAQREAEAFQARVQQALRDAS